MTAGGIITKGHLFDIYHIKDKTILWIKENSGIAKRLEYTWSPSIYVVSDKLDGLTLLLNNEQVLSFIKEYEIVNRYEYSSDNDKRQVLKLILKDSSQIIPLATCIENICKRFGHYRLYNVDILPEQAFLYEKDLYPLGSYEIKQKLDRRVYDPLFKIIIEDNNQNQKDSFDYVIPNFKFLSFDIISEKRSSTKIVNNVDDKIVSIIVKVFDKENNDVKENFIVLKDDEQETLLEFSHQVKRLDPDIILTNGGDQFLFPQLLYRAKINKIDYQILKNLNREPNIDFLLENKYKPILNSNFCENSNDASSSSSFISYGKVYFKPRPVYLYGRIHIDSNNSFIYKENGLDGLAEISRVCRIPLQLASRSTIGKCLSSLYFYNAFIKDVLIPWKPQVSECFKTFNDLLTVDKGGFVFESKPGLYEKVSEFDFVSLYPSIMFKKNISSDTINCNCCKYELDNRVPGLENIYHICKRKTGIVSLSLKTVLDRRLEYKKRKKDGYFCSDFSNNINELQNCYDNRQSALKWILVTSFGYLGFSNSKFGRIDAHIAVCAFARDILLKTSKVVENHGFEIIHGIVDSIWIKKRNTTIVDENSVKYKDDKIIYEELKKEIEETTGFSISFEGIYKWIVFDSSKEDNSNDLPALNRYFGVFEDGNTIRTRGIEARRHDTPPLFAKFQKALLQKMSCADSIDDVRRMMPLLEGIFKRYNEIIYNKKVHFSELVFTKRISKDSEGYLNSKRNTIENCVVNILFDYGKSLSAGQELRYIITDFYNKNSVKRSLPIELVGDSNTAYDITRYCKLLHDNYVSIIKYFK
jgi:DNA polymerase-2